MNDKRDKGLEAALGGLQPWSPTQREQHPLVSGPDDPFNCLNEVDLFYTERLASHGLKVITPDAEDRTVVNTVIHDELVLGHILPASRLQYQAIIHLLGQKGAQGIILGCTEIELLIRPEDTPLPMFATTRLHPAAAVTAALT